MRVRVLAREAHKGRETSERRFKRNAEASCLDSGLRCPTAFAFFTDVPIDITIDASITRLKKQSRKREKIFSATNNYTCVEEEELGADWLGYITWTTERLDIERPVTSLLVYAATPTIRIPSRHYRFLAVLSSESTSG